MTLRSEKVFLTFAPTEEILLRTHGGKDQRGNLMMYNKSDSSVGFKFRSNNYRDLTVSPSKGIMNPSEQKKVTIEYISHDSHAKGPDRIQILITPLDEKCKVDHDVRELFARVPQKAIQEHNFQIRYESSAGLSSTEKSTKNATDSYSTKNQTPTSKTTQHSTQVVPVYASAVKSSSPPDYPDTSSYKDDAADVVPQTERPTQQDRTQYTSNTDSKYRGDQSSYQSRTQPTDKSYHTDRTSHPEKTSMGTSESKKLTPEDERVQHWSQYYYDPEDYRQYVRSSAPTDDRQYVRASGPTDDRSWTDYNDVPHYNLHMADRSVSESRFPLGKRLIRKFSRIGAMLGELSEQTNMLRASQRWSFALFGMLLLLIFLLVYFVVAIPLWRRRQRRKMLPDITSLLNSGNIVAATAEEVGETYIENRKGITLDELIHLKMS